jgi:hypothetical protein
MIDRRWLPMAGLLVFVAVEASGQGSVPTPAQAAAFMGTWVVEMTEPPDFKATQTLRIWNRDGALAASVQTGVAPAVEVAGIIKDRNMLVLTLSNDAQRPFLENGAPIWAVIALTLDGDTIKVAHMLERSRTIKRGTGTKMQAGLTP